MRVAIAIGLALIACGDSKPEPEPEPQAKPEPGGVTPDWQRRIDDVPGTAVLSWVNGPVRHGEHLRVGSNAVGIVDLRPSDGEVLWQDKDAGPFVPAPEDPDLLAGEQIDGSRVTATRTSIERESKWRYDFEDSVDVGVAGPLLAGDTLVNVVDGTLIGLDWETGELRWKGEGRYAYIKGGLEPFGTSSVKAIALDSGIGPVLVDARTGLRGERIDAVPGLVAISASWSSDRMRVVVAVRRDAELYEQSIAAFTFSGKLVWEWDLPRPDGSRVDPIGVLTSGDAVFVFYDGRFVVRLPL